MQYKKKKEFMIAIGMFSLAISLLLDRFAGQDPLVDFLCGLFIGLSLAMNFGFLIIYGRERNMELKR